MSFACVPACIKGVGTLVALYAAIFSFTAFGQGGLAVFLSLTLLTAGVVLTFALPALAMGMLLIFVSGRYVLAHPVAFAAFAPGIGLLPGLVIGSFHIFLLMAVPGVIVSFVKLAGSFERIANEYDDREFDSEPEDA